MLENQSLIYFAPEGWDGLWRNRQQLMSIFARQNKVLFVEPRFYMRAMLSRFRPGGWSRAELNRPPIRRIAENLFVFNYPFWLPISERFPLNQITRTARRFVLQEMLRRLGMSQPIVWFSRPDMVDLIAELPPTSLLLYHVVDEYTEYSSMTSPGRRRLREREAMLMRQVDAVIVVSQKLYQSKCPFNAHTYLVPNGVNYEAYSAALIASYLPEVLQVIKKPRLGYIGLIGDKLDFNMLKRLALEQPDWSLIFLGEARVNRQLETWQALQALPNVHYLGPVEAALVPDYVKGFDVGLMPYHQNQHAENISPLKLYDYLAAGLPVVSVDIPAAREFNAYVHLANNPGEFIRSVWDALEDNSPERCQARRDAAAQHTWEARVEQLSVLIRARLDAKIPSSQPV